MSLGRKKSLTKMDKTFHFLAGLPRSGNTLLSSIFNQNPDIYSSPLSPLPSFLWDIASNLDDREHIARTESNKQRTQNFLLSFLDNFYKDVNKPVIIDREKAWGTPDNLELIKKYITPNPKIIFTVRDILEILASFSNLDFNFWKNQAENNNYFAANYRSREDLICEHLMATNGMIDKALLSLAPAFWEENKGIFHIVEYRDLIDKPEETMSKIYAFLEMPSYDHDFTNIKKAEEDNDEAVGLPKTLHDVRKSLSDSITNTDMLSDYVKHKYSNMEFWRENSLMKVRGKGL
jgi:sulfotransferase